MHYFESVPLKLRKIIIHAIFFSHLHVKRVKIIPEHIVY